MSLEAILRAVCYVAVGLAFLLAGAGVLVGQRAERGSAVARVAGVLVLLLDLALVLGVRPIAARIGPVIDSVAATVAAAITFAYIGGLWAGRQMRARRPVHHGAVVPALLIALTLLYSVYATAQRLARGARELGIGRGERYEPERYKDCAENLKSLYVAFSMYAQDYDALPPAKNWLDNEEIASRIVKDEWMHCPAVSNRRDDRYGYAYNTQIAGKSLNGKALREMPGAAKTPLLYDSTSLQKSAYDAFASLPSPGRHGGRNYVLYCDGHVEAVEPGKR